MPASQVQLSAWLVLLSVKFVQFQDRRNLIGLQIAMAFERWDKVRIQTQTTQISNYCILENRTRKGFPVSEVGGGASTPFGKVEAKTHPMCIWVSFSLHEARCGASTATLSSPYGDACVKSGTRGKVCGRFMTCSRFARS
ncbi:hypothetical protein PIB30_034129 [Stylosanthes scabra]|uniref:Secreted protein n=1 Tax=Stylosanthes scabra TaxID=79078 RepID=A0ABU6TCF8_9FABA|nr:hypothetical protein [Stylosanthes scabra]